MAVPRLNRPRAPRELVKRALLALAAVFCLQVIVFSVAVALQARFGALVDLTGRQRATVQQLAALVADPARDPAARDEIASAAARLTAASPLGEPVDTLRERYAAASIAAANGDAAAAGRVTGGRDDLVIAIDNRMRREAERRRVAAAALTGTLITAAVIAIAIIVALWRFGIAPAFAREAAGEQRLKSLFDNHPEGIVAVSRDGAVVDINEAMLRISGYRRQDVLGQNVERVTAPEFFESSSDARARMLAGTASELPSVIVRADGDRVPVALTTVPVLIDGKPDGLFAMVRDLRVQRRLERSNDDQRRLFATLFEHHPDVVVAVDTRGRLIMVNAATVVATGSRTEDLLGQSFRRLLHVPGGDALRAAVAAARGGTTGAFDAWLNVPSGDPVPLAVRLVPILRDGHFDGMYAIGRDVSVERRARMLEQRQRARLRALYSTAAAAGRPPLDQVADALRFGARELGMAYGFVGRVEGDVVTATCTTADDDFEVSAVRPLHESLTEPAIRAGFITCEDLARSEWRDRTRQGTAEWRALIATRLDVAGRLYGAFGFAGATPRERPFADDDREFVALLGALVSSALERLEQQAELDRLAHFDALTGLPNRVLLFDRIDRAIAAARRDGNGFALHYLDLDRFKLVNDTFGHAEGDDVLRESARRLQSVVRDVDTVARVGGDEFVIVQTGVVDDGDAERLVERVHASFRQPIAGAAGEHDLGISSGFALYPRDADAASALLVRADAKLYEEKRAKAAAAR